MRFSTERDAESVPRVCTADLQKTQYESFVVATMKFFAYKFTPIFGIFLFYTKICTCWMVRMTNLLLV